MKRNGFNITHKYKSFVDGYNCTFEVHMVTKNMFSEKEVEYLGSQRLARISTVSPEDLQPDVSPVGFDFDGQYFYVGRIDLPKTRKYKNVLKNKKVALVIDDLETVKPWAPRAVRIYGIADIVTRQGGYMDRAHSSSSSSSPPPSYIRIRPLKKWSWGIEEPLFT
jgi:pyridoxamine 5'-phosphate oxidase family protein